MNTTIETLTLKVDAVEDTGEKETEDKNTGRVDIEEYPMKKDDDDEEKMTIVYYIIIPVLGNNTVGITRNVMCLWVTMVQHLI